MNNKFADALKPGKAVIEPSTKTSMHARPSRQFTKHIGGYFEPTVSKQLRAIALEEDSSVQALLGEAIDMLFQSRRKPMIASKTKEKK